VRALTPSISTLGTIALAAVAALASGCHGDTEFDVKTANDFSPGGQVSVSVLGVFKDGYMSPETWDVLGPKLSPSLHRPQCESGFDSAFVEKNKAAAAAVDDYTRANGVTEPLLTELAPGAQGDLMMLVTVSGHTSKDNSYRHDTSTQMPGLAPAAGRQGGGTGNGYGGGFGNSSSPSSPAFNGRTVPAGQSSSSNVSVFEMTASFYSVSMKRSVAAVTMKYTGPREEDAIQLFADKLRSFVPNATCVGFRRDLPLEEDRVRSLPSSE
jgi:hypothetical protein